MVDYRNMDTYGRVTAPARTAFQDAHGVGICAASASRRVLSLALPVVMLSTLVLGGCSGGGAAGSHTVAVLPATHATGSVHLSFTVPPKLLSRLKQSSLRLPEYVAPTTASLVVTLAANGSAPGSPQTFPCSATCSATLAAPVGSNVISLELADATHILSLATTTVTVAAGITNNLNLTANPVVDHVGFSLGVASLNSGAATTIPITFNAYDADNNLIVGPGNFVDVNAVPVTLGLTATTTGAGSAAVNLSQSSFTAPPATPITATFANGWASTVNIAAVVPASIAAHSVSPLTSSVPVMPSSEEFYTGISGGPRLNGITAGSDGNIYALESNTNIVDRITPAGIVTQIPIPIPGATTIQGPWDIITGPDGNLWFTMNNNLGGGPDGAVVKMTPAGAFTFYTGGSISNGQPFGIATGPDGNIWFAENASSLIGKITPAGVLTEYGGIHGYGLNGITGGPDGNVWFTEAGDNADDGSAYIGKITPSGTITDWHLPAGNFSPHYIVTGPDHNLWYSEHLNNAIGRITPSGTISQFSVPGLTGAADNGTMRGIVVGQDGRIWTVMDEYTGLAAIDTSGNATYYPSATSSIAYGGAGFCVGPDGNLWATQQDDGIARYAFN